jgi:hypothetical protein
MAVIGQFRMEKSDFYRDGIFKLVPRWEKYISVFGDHAEED